MAYPVGVTTRNCTFSDPVDAEDGSQEIERKRAIVSCNGKIIHISTGVILIPTPQIFTTDFALPVTDQDGIWMDESGNTYVGGGGYNTHSYRVDLEYKTDDGRWEHLRSIEHLVINTSGSNLDLDLVFDVNRTAYDGA